jgi:hypothetical protein
MNLPELARLRAGEKLTGEHLVEALRLLERDEIIEVIASALNLHLKQKGLHALWREIEDFLSREDRERLKAFLRIDLTDEE